MPRTPACFTRFGTCPDVRQLRQHATNRPTKQTAFSSQASRLCYVLVHTIWLIIAFVFALVGTSAPSFAQIAFKHHFGDADLQGRSMGQTDLADVDRDGDLDFITGEQRGRIFWYEFQSPDTWVRHELGVDSPSDVGGVALDVNEDGWVDFVTGGAWYENTTNPLQGRFERHLFDAELAAVHDIVLADLDGDGRQDVVTMSDKNDLRWYRVSPQPGRRWTMHPIGESVHSGVSSGDLDGDGDIDVVRSNVWFENRDRGTKWVPHKMTEPWGAATPSFAVNATQTEIADINADGRPDVVMCDGENPAAKIAWLEAPPDPKSGEWLKHDLPRGDEAARGALHSLKLADFDLDGDVDIFTVEMERFAGEKDPRWFVWENKDGKGTLVERVILDANLGGHEAVCGDVDADGDIDICAKPWSARKNNALGGRSHFDFLENLAADRN